MDEIIALQEQEPEEPQGAEALFGLDSWVSLYGDCYHRYRRRFR